MGYQTIHSLTTIPPNAKGASKMVADVVGYDPFGDQCKWYDHEVDMVAVSVKHPAIIFVVRGEGEEAGDQWIMYVHEGKFVKYNREDWDPPAVSQSMLDNRTLAMDAVEREQSAATERRERDLLAKLQAKYQGGDA